MRASCPCIAADPDPDPGSVSMSSSSGSSSPSKLDGQDEEGRGSGRRAQPNSGFHSSVVRSHAASAADRSALRSPGGRSDQKAMAEEEHPW